MRSLVQSKRHAHLPFCIFRVHTGFYQYVQGLSAYIQACTYKRSKWTNVYLRIHTYEPSLSTYILVCIRFVKYKLGKSQFMCTRFVKVFLFILVWTWFIYIHTWLYQDCIDSYMSGILQGTFWYIQLHAGFVLIHAFNFKSWNSMYSVLIGTTQFFCSPYHAMLWNCYKPT